MKATCEHQWNKNCNETVDKNYELIKHNRVKIQSYQEEVNNTVNMQGFGGRK